MVFKYVTGLIPPILVLTGAASSSTVGLIVITHELLMNPYIKNLSRVVLPNISVPSGHVMTSQLLFVLVPSKFTLGLLGFTCVQRITVAAATPKQVMYGGICGTILGFVYKFLF